jgi:NadR type nicotinamide-nucleotide adenylyltransferase
MQQGRDTLVTACGGIPDALVCAAEYGVPLAEALGCTLLPLDIAREAIPLCATAIRADPWAMWERMLPHARVPYLARVAIEGPESTGKSTIARDVARGLGFTYAPEWAKCFIEQCVRQGHAFAEPDLLTIARGHSAAERSLDLVAHRAVIADTSLLTTLVWGRFLYGRSDARIEALFAADEARAPRHRWFFTPDTPWVADTHRDVAADAAAPETRRRFWDLLLAEAERRGVRYEIVPGGFAEKQQRALALALATGACAPP